MVTSCEGHWTLRFKLNWRKGGRKRAWKKQVDEKSMKVGMRREDVLC